MHIALISDIHGNQVSFDAVLADINRIGVDRIIFLGDAATLGPQPRDVLASLRTLRCTCIMGNHDSYLLNVESGREYLKGQPLIADSIDWCASQLSTDDLEFIRSFQSTVRVPLADGADLLCFHGTPRSNTEQILASTSVVELETALEGHTATVMAGGHTHVQMLRRHKGVILVNAGSVGEPFEQMPPADYGPRIMPWAEYAIVGFENGAVSVELRRVPIDLHRVRDAAFPSDNPLNWADYWIIL